MDASLIRQMVGEFRERTGFVGAKQHCFAGWYLHQFYELSEVEALKQSSGNGQNGYEVLLEYCFSPTY